MLYGNLVMPSCFIVYIIFFTPNRAILQYSTPDVFPVLYDNYSTNFPFDRPIQNSLSCYIAVADNIIQTTN